MPTNALTTTDAIRIETTNNIDTSIYKRVQTSIGGFVWVNAEAHPDIYELYLTGRLLGNEPPPTGVYHIILPSIYTETQHPVAHPPNTNVSSFPIRVIITAADVATTNIFPINVIVSPAGTAEETFDITYPFITNTTPISINIIDPLLNLAYDFIESALTVYVDEDRELKTLLNYGEDRQSVAISYRNGPVDTSGINTIQLKLLQPVPLEVDETTPVFLSREVAKTLIDKVRIRFAPELDETPYLRPKNLGVNTEIDLGKRLNNVTLKLLSLQTGSVGANDQYANKTFEDEIFRRWYSYDFDSSELNIDFTNYSNFVFYGSAAMRLSAFREKLKLIERVDSNRKQFISSSTYTMSSASAAAVFVQEKTAEYASQIENIIRSFDRYDQYLYFTPSGSNSPYTASAYYADGGYEYNSVGYWPKDSSGSVLYSYDAESTEWFDTQYGIAQRFDDFNENNLINTIPTHLREDDDNSSYFTFVSMIGHFFDTLKPYIDQFPYIYSRNLNPAEELSKDLISDIAESVGFKLPTLNSTYDLTNNILGSEADTPRRDLTVEIYKRLLHNLPFFAKAKGTKTALQTLLKSFGITPQLISVKETGTVVTSSYNVFDEYTSGLDFDTTKISYISLPIAASSRTPTTMQLSCTVATPTEMTILTGDNKWALISSPHPSNPLLGKILLTSGSNHDIILSSSYQEIFGDELLNITIQNTPSETLLYVMQTEGEDIVFQSIASTQSVFLPIWNATSFVYAGGAGSLVGNRFNGTIDEIRVWNDTLSDEVIINTAFDPGSNAGDTYQSAAQNLLLQISFNIIDYSLLQASSSLVNESPYPAKSTAPSIETVFAFNVTGSDFSRYNRTIRQPMIAAGASGYQTDKIRVVPPPVFLDTSADIKTLYRTKSIVSAQQKRLQRGRNKVIISSSPTDIVNQNIIRNFGLENINAVLGSPSDMYSQYDNSLQELKNYYQQYYYVDVNANTFIRVLSEVNSIVDQMLDYFIPSKATVLSGVVIEPNILEQVKIRPIKNMRVYGKNTRKTMNAAGSLTSSRPDYSATYNVSDTISTLDDTSIEGTYNSYRTQTDPPELISLMGSISDLTGTVTTVPMLITGSVGTLKLNLSAPAILADGDYVVRKAIIETPRYESSGSILPLKGQIANLPTVISGSYPVLRTQLDTSVAQTVDGKMATYVLAYDSDDSIIRTVSKIDVGLSHMNKIAYNDVNGGSNGAEPYNRLYPRKLSSIEVNTERNGGNKSIYIPALYDIPPSTDFRDFGVYTYFNNKQGIYYFPQPIKTPTYPKPLNQQWNADTQAFVGISTWSYGNRFNQYDVVYQNIDSSYATDLGSDAVRASLVGNELYYVFKTRPSYSPPSEKIAFDSGSVPSYTPPSLDRENWDVLRFIPSQKLVAKRVVFDTFTIPDPAENNFKTTAISVDKVIDIPNRYVDKFTLPIVAANSYATGELLVQNISTLFAMQATDADIRLRLYRTVSARDADVARPLESFPSGSHGVMLDMIYSSANVSEYVGPITTILSGDSPENGKIYFTVDNLTSSVKPSITLILYYFAMQIEKRVPLGYLRKHYRFFRDNSTALKRRNYDGCKNTVDTTVDGLPPIQIFLSEGSDIIVSATTTNEEIITGGGGQLEVT